MKIAGFILSGIAGAIAFHTGGWWSIAAVVLAQIASPLYLSQK